VPNALTLIRLAGIPVLAVAAHRSRRRTSPRVGYLYGAIAVTDWFDGWLARRMKAQSRFGQIADPAVDRLLSVAGQGAIVSMGRVGPVGPGVLVGREVLAVTGFLVAARRGVVMEVDMAGKASSALVMVATGGMLLVDEDWTEHLYRLSVVVAGGTLVHYVWRARRELGGGGDSEQAQRGPRS
jgi:CDP-diacylglycerol--glycerol-3-phosphate 3-phosphatidyltransferase